MSNDKFQNKYRIPSARAAWHDYGGGAYFVTVCTKNREHFFGEIVRCRDGAHPVSTVNGEAQMILTPIGQCLTEIIENTPKHCPYCEIPLFVVMPNHFHAIVFIDGEKTPYQRREITRRSIVETGRVVETGHAPSLQETMRNVDKWKGWLSVAIGGIKSAVTKFANKNEIEFAWQTRFDDRIIRNQNSMNEIADYVENNVARWDIDCFNEINQNK